ncbi:MAG: NAD(P)-dependent oxidoreductase, partial [Myxococcales bacterium]|nr:NAD(P)-dependent oxidoreductase [Myxococcales bacterium]
MSMKVALTGATGFLGSHLAEQLTREGHKVRAIVRGTSNTKFLNELGAEIVQANLHTGEGLDKAVSDVDAVVHGAAVVKARSEAEFHSVNAGGTERVLDAVKRHNPKVKRFVYVSSLAAHGFSDDGKPRAVTAEARPVTHYGRSKLAGERKVLESAGDLPITVIRPPAIYGPRDTEMFAFFQTVQRRLIPFMGDPNNTLSIAYAPDVANGIYLALTKEHDSGRVYFVEAGNVYTQ